MRITVGEISKAVTEAVYSTPRKITGADHKAAMQSLARAQRGGLPSAERSAGRWARAAANGDLDRETSRSMAWTKSDDARMRSIGNKVGKLILDAVTQFTGRGWEPRDVLTDLELATIKKMTQQELADAISGSRLLERTVANVVKWARRS